MRNLSIWQKSLGTWQPIPMAQNPVIVKRSEWDPMVLDARMVLSCFPQILAWIQHKENLSLWQILFGGMTGIEADAARRNPAETWGHATIRFDLFWHGAELKLIEANCTIPAMQAYSDMVLAAWSESRGLPIPPRGNSDDLLDSLLALYRRDGGQAIRPRLGILHREGDAQLAELEYLTQHWQDRVEAVRVTPSQWEEQSFDLVYRHVFASRLSQETKLLTALHDSRRSRIYNPVSAHYEVKAFLAMVSVVASNDQLAATVGLSADQREATRRRVPWTRIIPSEKYQVNVVREAFGSRTDIDCASDSDFDSDSDFNFAGHCDDYVIKNSLGYGGHLVFVGSEWHQDATQARLKSLLKMNSQVSPALFWRWVRTESQDTWVIQQRMSGRRHKSKVLIEGRELAEIDGYADASVFLNTGTKPLCGGGVSRFASGPVVNIGTGGGLAPFIVES